MTDRVVAFRCNSGPKTGFGHLMRCRELARMLRERGVASAICGPDMDQRTESDRDLFIKWTDEAISSPDRSGAEGFLSFCESVGARHAILDDYRVGAAHQRRLHQAGLRFIHQFDASAPPGRFWADFAVNANPYETEDKYAGWIVNPGGRLCLGPEYAVLRPEFAALEKRPPAARVSNILLTFGGGDDRGMILTMLEALAPRIEAGLSVEIVSGARNPRNGEISAALAARSDAAVALHIGPPNVAEIMARADLAVMAGGTSTYEAAHCGLPMALVALAPNQVNPGLGWAEHTGAEFLGEIANLTMDDIRRGVGEMIDNDARRIETARRSRRKVDGLGGERLLSALLTEPEA